MENTSHKYPNQLAKLFHRLVVNIKHRFLAHWQQCEMCQQTTLNDMPLCNYCLTYLPKFDLAKVNGDLLNSPEIYRLFPKASFDHLICFSPYQIPTSQWISRLKYQRDISYQALLNALIYQQLLTLKNLESFSPPDVIIPVPLHIKKWQQRGFNQCSSMAKFLGEYFSVPVEKNAVIRTKYADGQVSKSGAERRKNLKHSFSLNREIPLTNKHIWLIDDVVTTGTTANEISRQLKAAYVNKITLFTVAIST